MSAPGAVRIDASPISVVAASARTALGTEHTSERDALDAVSREGFDAVAAAEKARALPGKMWTIVAAGLVAWALVAIPAWLIFG